MLNQLCSGLVNFMSVVDLISTFEDSSVYHDSIIEGLLEGFNNLIPPSKTSNSKNSLLEIFNIFSSVLKNHLMIP